MIHIRDEVARLPGVADFQLFGDRQYAMRIGSILRRLLLTTSAQAKSWSALRAQNAQVSAGVLNQPPVTTRCLSAQHRGVGRAHHTQSIDPRSTRHCLHRGYARRLRCFPVPSELESDICSCCRDSVSLIGAFSILTICGGSNNLKAGGRRGEQSAL